MFNYFIFNKKHSIKDFEMYFETLPLLPVLDDVNQISCTCGFKTDKVKILHIKKWLSVTTGQLKFSFDDRTFSVTNITVQEANKNSIYTVVVVTFTVENTCLLQSNPIEFTKDFHQINLYNGGNYESLPLISIEGSGNISITINDEDCCTIENVNGVVTIDSQIQECWVGNQEDISSLKNRDFYGEFPILAEGMNHICIDSTTNNLVKVIIEPRWAI